MGDSQSRILKHSLGLISSIFVGADVADDVGDVLVAFLFVGDEGRIIIVLDLYVWLLIASAILSWLIAFNVVNTRNQFVAAVAEFLYRITEPVLAPIRRMLPSLGGLDISPIVVILIIMFIQRVIAYYIYPNVL